MKPLMAGALAVLMALSVDGADAGLPTAPQEVLAAVEQAYATGDVTLLRSFLTPDYEFLSQQGIEFTVDRELELVGQLIQKNECTLSFSKDVDLKCLTVNPRTWAIPHLQAKLVVMGSSKTLEVTNLVTLYLIEDVGTGAVRIFRWIEEPTALQGCD